MVTIPQSSADVADFLPLRRFSTGDYLQMIEAGVLGPSDRVELIEGIIVEMSPAGIPHNHALMMLIELFAPLVGRFKLAIQGTLTVAEGHVYDPDLMLLRQRPDNYKSKLPDAADVLLVIEASESSLRRDQQVKLPVHAATGIAEYWIADLERELLLVHREPKGNTYGSIETHQGDDVVAPLAASDLTFSVRQIFD